MRVPVMRKLVDSQATNHLLLSSNDTERKICFVICRSDGIRAKEISDVLGIDRKAVNRVLYSSPLLGGHTICELPFSPL